MPVNPQLDAIFVGLGATALPPGPDYIPVVPGQAHQGFQDAIDSLPDNGGTLYIMPGTAAYTFGQTVLVNKPNVTIDFVGGSTLTFGASAATSLFSVSQPGFRCYGARVVHSIASGNNPNDRSCFLIQADDADISGCRFEIRQGDVAFAIRYFSCIRVLQLFPLEGFRSGIRVARNTFILDKEGIDQTEPWVPAGQSPTGYTLPRGVCCIGAEFVRGLILSGNTFRSNASGTTAACGPALYLVTSEQCSVSSNTLRDLRASAGGSGPDRGSIVRLLGHLGEGHHTVISANAFTEIESAILIGLDLVKFDYIAANVFDRIGSATRPCWSVVRAQFGEVLGIVGNVFTRVTGGGGANEAGIFLHGLAECTISGNLFSEVQTGAGVLATTPGTTSNVHFEPQQAQSDND